MEEFKLYSVSDDYVEWLRKDFPNVYSNKINSRTHTRKYLGVVLQIGQYLYYVRCHRPKIRIIRLQEQIRSLRKALCQLYEL